MTLYLLSYNNYYNRIIKKFETLVDYSPYVLDIINNVNFNPNDGVGTSQIVNYSGANMPDYLLVVEANQIVSRWFIIENKRIRKNQYLLTLHRDLIADNYEGVINAPTFIEKATLSADDPMIFNSEAMTFNEIKTSETALKDRSGCAWLVGYMARTNGEVYTSFSGKANVVVTPDIIINGPITDWEYFDKVQKPLYGTPRVIRYDAYYKKGASAFRVRQDCAETKSIYVDVAFDDNTQLVTTENPIEIKNVLSGYYNQLYAAAKPTIPWEDPAEYYALSGKVIQYKDSSGGDAYARIATMTLEDEQLRSMTLGPNNGTTYTTWVNAINAAGITGNPGSSLTLNYQRRKFYISLTPVTSVSVDYSVPAERNHASDAPYDLFCIPYGDEITVRNVKNGDATLDLQPSKNLMLGIATSMAEQQGAKIYDIQILPYCPMQGLISAENEIDLISRNSYDYSLLKESDTAAIVGVILFPQVSSFSLDVPLKNPITITEPKVQSECDMYRLCSPNFNGQFEFNAAKNGGITRFNVDCTCIPHNPYIHINPDFGKLYGRDFNDARGLICGGDFSIARVTDAWVSYQLQNKNYEASFQRQIQNMETKRKYERAQQISGAVIGTITGGASGGVVGGMSGNPIAAGVGAAVGGIGSAIAGGMDVYTSDQLHNETLDYTKDQFGFQLDNIKAMPDSIAKTTAFTNNNKIFPILEYYTCTEQEKQALRDKIKYNGMTVGRIGKIKDFLQATPSYIKGKIIRLEDISDDFNYLTAIAAELNKGVFI